MLSQGDHFKKFVVEVKDRSALYKQKKAEIGDLTIQYEEMQRNETELKAQIEETKAKFPTLQQVGFFIDEKSFNIKANPDGPKLSEIEVTNTIDQISRNVQVRDIFLQSDWSYLNRRKKEILHRLFSN